MLPADTSTPLPPPQQAHWPARGRARPPVRRVQGTWLYAAENRHGQNARHRVDGHCVSGACCPVCFCSGSGELAGAELAPNCRLLLCNSNGSVLETCAQINTLPHRYAVPSSPGKCRIINRNAFKVSLASYCSSVLAVKQPRPLPVVTSLCAAPTNTPPTRKPTHTTHTVCTHKYIHSTPTCTHNTQTCTHNTQTYTHNTHSLSRTSCLVKSCAPCPSG